MIKNGDHIILYDQKMEILSLVIEYSEHKRVTVKVTAEELNPEQQQRKYTYVRTTSYPHTMKPSSIRTITAIGPYCLDSEQDFLKLFEKSPEVIRERFLQL